MDITRALKFFEATEATWVDLGGRYLVLREKDVEELRHFSGPVVQVQDMSLSQDQVHVILGHFA